MAKIVVVGANHAGTACINTILDNYKGHEVVVYDKNNNISFLGCGMALWIGKQISGSDGLFYATKDGLQNKGAQIHMEAEITSVDYDKKVIRGQFKDGTPIEDTYDKLILATGSSPIEIPVPGKDLENIQFVKLFQNAQEVIDKLKLPEIKRVAVLGSGYIGVELAEAFQLQGKEVVLVDMLETILGTHFDHSFSMRMQNLMASKGIHMAMGEKVQEFVGKDGKVCAVKTDKATHEVDMVISCVGFRPNNGLGKDHLELFRNGAYLVNRKQETSAKDVYAIGDCATVYDNSIDDVNYIALATNAVRSGIVAAHNACGTTLESIGVQGSSGISIYGLKMVGTGLTEAKAKNYGIETLTTSFKDIQKPAFMEDVPNGEVEIKIVYRKDNRQIVGAQMISTYDMSSAIHMFSLAIYKKLTIDELKLLDIFFMPHFNQPYNYITMAALAAE
ncbi:MAG: FAD-dependent oxidoreductase [Bacillota bacterium]|nr:FAD-dependent oxidoreductase [Bacillota bacterium]